MLTRLQGLSYNSWYSTLDPYSTRAANFYRDAVLTSRLILRVLIKQNRKLNYETELLNDDRR